MKVVVQNLQKQSHLGSEVIHKYNPDVLLAQEINLKTEDPNKFLAHFVSKLGYGTAIYCRDGHKITNVRKVESPHAEIGGFIRKKTTVANYSGIDFIDFHGYNGQPMKNCSKLVDHVQAVLKVVSESSPAVFSGDFNTWTDEHVQAVANVLRKVGFRLSQSWSYPGRQVPLDHVFVRNLQIEDFRTYANSSDHHGAIFELIQK